MEFFNFGNDQTFHFFQWIVNSGKVNLEDLLRRAYGRVEQNDSFQMGMDVSFAAKQELTHILDELLENEALDWSAQHDIPLSTTDGGVEMFAASGNYQGADALFTPLIEMQLGEIWTGVAAKALLMRAGKWAPDRDRPELL